jgi:hypothetical protein
MNRITRKGRVFADIKITGEKRSHSTLNITKLRAPNGGWGTLPGTPEYDGSTSLYLT